jgi:hypothetical protein
MTTEERKRDPSTTAVVQPPEGGYSSFGMVTVNLPQICNRDERFW